jgi:hypothetical protein
VTLKKDPLAWPVGHRNGAVFYGLALNASALPTDKTYANKRKAAEILNKVWAEQPNHPGVVHYLIHSDDSAEFAAAGLDAATYHGGGKRRVGP